MKKGLFGFGKEKEIKWLEICVITLEGGHESMGKYLKDGLKLLLNK